MADFGNPWKTSIIAGTSFARLEQTEHIMYIPYLANVWLIHGDRLDSNRQGRAVGRVSCDSIQSFIRNKSLPSSSCNCKQSDWWWQTWIWISRYTSFWNWHMTQKLKDSKRTGSKMFKMRDAYWTAFQSSFICPTGIAHLKSKMCHASVSDFLNEAVYTHPEPRQADRHPYCTETYCTVRGCVSVSNPLWI